VRNPRLLNAVTVSAERVEKLPGIGQSLHQWPPIRIVELVFAAHVPCPRPDETTY
jgi:hypothetical protein